MRVSITDPGMTLVHSSTDHLRFGRYNSTAANQVVEAHREAQRQAGAEIASDARRSLEEQLLAIQARLQPAHRMIRRLQRVGA